MENCRGTLISDENVVLIEFPVCRADNVVTANKGNGASAGVLVIPKKIANTALEIDTGKTCAEFG